MAVTPEQICSNALIRLGALGLTTFTDQSGDGGLHRVELCNALWPQTRDELLASHTWRFAQSRVVLAPDYTPIATVATLGATTGQTTLTATGAFAGVQIQRLVVSGTGSSAGIGIVNGLISNNSVSIQVFQAFASTTLASGAWGLENKPAFEYAHRFRLPTDFLRLTQFGETNADRRDYDTEGLYLLAQKPVAFVKYTKSLTDTTLWPVYATNLAEYSMMNAICYALKQSGDVARTVEEKYMRHLSFAKSLDSVQYPADHFYDSPFINVRSSEGVPPFVIR